jgi:uncharacterized protein (DUF934 family)
MPLLKDGEIVADTWTTVEAVEDLREGTPAIVPVSLWREHRESLTGRNAPLGIRLNSDESPDLIAGDLSHFDVVALAFPKATDGRAYSSASLLRERYGFTGEIRAVGHLARDQAMFMWRCGFDSFEIPAADDAGAWIAAMQRFSVAFQPAVRGAAPAPWRPHARARAHG